MKLVIDSSVWIAGIGSSKGYASEVIFTSYKSSSGLFDYFRPQTPFAARRIWQNENIRAQNLHREIPKGGLKRESKPPEA